MTSCPDCGAEKERLGQHISMSSCNYPVIDIELLDGLLLGDGDIYHTGKNPCLRVRNTNRLWLEQLSEQIPWSYGPTLAMTAEELAERDDSSGFNEGATAENYNDIYRWQTINNPNLLAQRERWYPGGDKRVPDDIELTPTVVRQWLAGDGNISWGESFGGVRFGRADERDDSLLIERLDGLGFEKVYRNGNHIQLGNEDSRQLLKWCGPPVRGFDYKWECHDRNDYDRLKRAAYRRGEE